VTTADWIALAGVVVVAAGSYLTLRFSIRQNANERSEAAEARIRQAIQDALAPVIADRDYYRTRCDQLEDELRRQGRGQHRND